MHSSGAVDVGLEIRGHDVRRCVSELGQTAALLARGLPGLRKPPLDLLLGL